MDERAAEFTESWDSVVGFTDVTTPDIPLDALPGWSGDFVNEVSQCAQTPKSFGLMLCFSVLATCLQKRFVVSPFDDSYAEPVNLWTIGVMAPGARKTFVVEELTAPLLTWERDRALAMQRQIDEAEAARIVAVKRIERLQGDAAKQRDPAQRAALTKEICDLKEAMPREIRAPRLFTNDCTPERFQSLLVEHGERMAVLSDEGGIFDVMSGLYSDGRANVDVFLKSHAGSTVRVDRGGRSAHLDNPLSTFGLAVQPAVIEELSKGSKRRFRGTGCLARFLYCVPPSNVGKRDMTRRRVITPDTRERYAIGIRSLLSIKPDIKDGVQQPKILRLDAEARLSWTAYQQALEKRQGEAGDLSAISDWTAKLPGAALRLAALSHVAANGPDQMVISQLTIESALDLADLLIQHALCAFSLMGSDEATSDAQHVARWIRAKGVPYLRQHDIYRGCHGRIHKMDRLVKALSVLIDRNMLSEPVVEKTGGHPATVFFVNPEFLGVIQ